MHVIRRRGWEIPESQATPEHVFVNRRAFLGTAAGAVLFFSCICTRCCRARSDGLGDLGPPANVNFRAVEYFETTK